MKKGSDVSRVLKNRKFGLDFGFRGLRYYAALDTGVIWSVRTRMDFLLDASSEPKHVTYDSAVLLKNYNKRFFYLLLLLPLIKYLCVQDLLKKRALRNLYLKKT